MAKAIRLIFPLLLYNCKTLVESSVVFDVFTIPFLSGNPETALIEPYAIVFTESMAKKQGPPKPMDPVYVYPDYVTIKKLWSTRPDEHQQKDEMI